MLYDCFVLFGTRQALVTINCRCTETSVKLVLFWFYRENGIKVQHASEYKHFALAKKNVQSNSCELLHQQIPKQQIHLISALIRTCESCSPNRSITNIIFQEKYISQQCNKGPKQNVLCSARDRRIPIMPYYQVERERLNNTLPLYICVMC